MWNAVYGLDIETDTSELTDNEKTAGHTSRGLDPRIGGITAVAIAHNEGTEVWTAEEGREEASMLMSVHFWLSKAEPGLIVTWNGSVFDMPFIAARLKKHRFEQYGPQLTLDIGITPKHAPLPGYEGGYTATWPTSPGYAAHAHLDMAYYARNLYSLSGQDWALKPFARSRGYEPVELERGQLHLYSEREQRAYVASDAEVTRQLALDLLGGLPR